MKLIKPTCRYDGAPVEYFGQLCAECDPTEPVGIEPDPLMDLVRDDLARLSDKADD